jgi:hypothetical protein
MIQFAENSVPQRCAIFLISADQAGQSVPHTLRNVPETLEF